MSIYTYMSDLFRSQSTMKGAAVPIQQPSHANCPTMMWILERSTVYRCTWKANMATLHKVYNVYIYIL